MQGFRGAVRGYLATAAAGLVLAGAAPEAGAKTVRVNAKDGSSIQAAIDKLPAEGGTVAISGKGEILVARSIVIDRDSVTLAGEGQGATVLRLADHANAPVLIVGESLAAPAVMHRNIHVRDLTIDGNRENQDGELNPANPALRNNGVSLRRVESCSVRNVTLRSCRSGGLVAELGCRRLTVRDIESYDHAFDGIAACETEDSLFTGLHLHDNLAAGLSFDLDFARNLVSDALVNPFRQRRRVPARYPGEQLLQPADPGQPRAWHLPGAGGLGSGRHGRGERVHGLRHHRVGRGRDPHQRPVVHGQRAVRGPVLRQCRRRHQHGCPGSSAAGSAPALAVGRRRLAAAWRAG